MSEPLNIGAMSPEDVERLTEWAASLLGSMPLRDGTRYIGTSADFQQWRDQRAKAQAEAIAQELAD